MIDVSPLTNAVRQLAPALQEQRAEPDRVLLRAGLIQTFEYTFELSHKMMRRYLASVADSPDEVLQLTFEGLIRRADELRLLASPVAVWKEFRQARTETSHTYSEQKATAVAAKIPAFLEEAQFLSERLQERTQADARLGND